MFIAALFTIAKTWRKPKCPSKNKWIKWCGIYTQWNGTQSWKGWNLSRVRTSVVAQMVKNLPAMQETQVWSLGREDPLEKGMATHSSVLAWRIPGTGEPGGLSSMGSHRVGHDWSDLAAAAAAASDSTTLRVEVNEGKKYPGLQSWWDETRF